MADQTNHPGLPKDILGLEGFSSEGITYILDTAETFKEVSERDVKKVPALKGRLVALFFHENSTRTRLSFEVAAKRLSADTIALSSSGSSLSKGESLLDTVKNIEAMAPDAVVIRHGASGAPHFVGRHLKCAVINAGDGAHEHPSQALLDMLTIRQAKGGFKGLKVAIIGDITHSRVARSNLIGLKTMGAEVALSGPPTMMPPGLAEEYGALVFDRPEPALAGADVVIMLRIQLERQSGALFPGAREYARVYGLNQKRFALADSQAILLHPGPVNQGVELTPDMYGHSRSLILPQVANGVAVRMALLYLWAGGHDRLEARV